MGDTREAVYRVFGDPEKTDVLGFVAFADYAGRSFVFVLTREDTESPEDRVMDILLFAPSYVGWSNAEARKIALGLLPADAVAIADMYNYSIDGIFIDYRQQYRSDSLAHAVSSSGTIYCGQDDPDADEPAGTVWVKLTRSGADPDAIKTIQVTTQGC